MPEELTFARLTLTNWRQFGLIDLDLRSRLTVITGANGAGKTSIVSLLGRHFNWQSLVAGLPIRAPDGRLMYLSGIRNSNLSDEELGALPGQPPIGSISYSNDVVSRISIPAAGNPVYEPSIESQQSIPGLYLTSHRSANAYRAIESMPTQFNASTQVLDQYVNEIKNRYFGAYSAKSSMMLMKESLLAAAVFSQGSDAVEYSQEAHDVWTGFQNVLRRLLPESLGFNRLYARPPEVVMQTSTGQFVLDAVSGGISALLELGWQIYLRSREHSVFTVCMDEPENHLHPSLQRSIIPGLLDAFPGAHFIIATHSPFIVTAEPAANVYALTYDDSMVVSELLDFNDKSASAEDTLRDVLGVDSTAPLWAERRFDEILSRYTREPASAEILRRLRQELDDSGLGRSLPDALDRILPNSGSAP